MSSHSFIFPKPILPPKAVKKSAASLSVLLKEEYLLLDSSFRDGLQLLNQLSHHLQKPSEKAPYREQKLFAQQFRKQSSYLLVPILDHQIQLQGAPECGFLKEFYPEHSEFLLPFPQVQELAGAWLQYRDGIKFPVLGHRLHPFYGTYFPKRTAHLELFATWLHQYQGAKESCVDMGAGSGILSFLLERKGFQSILAIDYNPNAIESIQREVQRHSYQHIKPILSNLFTEIKDEVELIVFNPPWIRGESDSLVNQALFSDEKLLQHFFEQAHQRLKPAGRIVLVYSNIGSLLFPKEPHPLFAELDKGRFTLAQKLQRKIKPSSPQKRTKEKVEIWELIKK